MPSPFTPPGNQLPHGMKPKKKFQPEVQMKRANWTKVHSSKLEADSFWVKANEESLASDAIFGGLTEKFASKAPSKKKLYM